MFISKLTVSRRYSRLLVPLIAALVAGAVVAGVSLATNSSSTTRNASTATSAGAKPGLALQGAFVKVVQSVSPSVVQIEDQTGLGSGIVLDFAGDIVTNNHVVTGATSLTVTTSTGVRYPAKLVGSFAPDDLAVVKVSPVPT
jgi:putative serine protease PepD